MACDMTHQLVQAIKHCSSCGVVSKEPLGTCRFAFFLAQDTFDHTGTLLKSLLYMVMYYSFAQPRAVIWQMYLCTVAIVYACTGTAYLMSQVSNE